jgi:hypothetical protein
MRALALAMLLAAAPANAAEQSFAADTNGAVSFQMPSANIGCVYVPPGGTAVYRPEGGGPELSCDRIEPAYVTLTLGPLGAARLNTSPGEVGCCGGPVLRYGNVWREGPFSCHSRRDGLTCRRDDGRGFTLARAGISIF